MENQDTKSFAGLNLSENILRAVNDAGYDKPSPIQAKAIPLILEGRDVFGCAQTGTGKTAAFALPIMQMLEERGHYPRAKQFRALILTPTRELAEQIATNIVSYGKYLHLSCCKIYGGVSQNPQVKMLSNGIDIAVATPGRLLDLFRQKGLDFGGVEYLVLDEADRMLDMGFIPDIRRICKELPKNRQSLLFSATLSSEIESLARDIVRDPVRISISPDKPTVEKISQKVAFVDFENKFDLLETMMKERLEKSSDALALIFCRTKHGANKLAKRILRNGIEAGVIHGNKSQSARKTALDRFKNREINILVATDIAARGIDVKDMSLVVNFDLPEDPETYVHRIGRTARAEADGEAVSFCSPDDADLLRDIERFIKNPIPRLENNPFHSEAAAKQVERKHGGFRFAVKTETPRRAPTRQDYGFNAQKNDSPRRGRSGRQESSENRPQRSEHPERAERPARQHSDHPKGAKPSGDRRKKQDEKIGSVLKNKMRKAGIKHLPNSAQKNKKGGFWQKLKSKFGK